MSPRLVSLYFFYGYGLKIGDENKFLLKIRWICFIIYYLYNFKCNINPLWFRFKEQKTYSVVFSKSYLPCGAEMRRDDGPGQMSVYGVKRILRFCRSRYLRVRIFANRWLSFVIRWRYIKMTMCTYTSLPPKSGEIMEYIALTNRFSRTLGETGQKSLFLKRFCQLNEIKWWRLRESERERECEKFWNHLKLLIQICQTGFLHYPIFFWGILASLFLRPRADAGCRLRDNYVLFVRMSTIAFGPFSFPIKFLPVYSPSN